MQRFFLTIITITSCVLTVVPLQQASLKRLKADAKRPTAEQLTQQDQIEEQRLRLLTLAPSVGFNNLVADWTFLNFLQYFGDEEVRRQTNFALSPHYLNTVLHNDPHFWDAYLFLSSSTTLYAGQPDRTIEIMETYLPKISPKAPDRAYFIWRWKATDELLFLGNPKAAQESYQTAAQWAAEYDTEEGRAVAATSAKTAQFLTTNPDSRVVQVSAWMGVYGNAFDQETRQLAIDNIRALGGDVILDEEGNVVEVRTPQE